MTIVKKILFCTIVAAAEIMTAAGFAAGAQEENKEDPRIEQYAERYNLLVSKLGYDGVGIETLLDGWEKIAPEDVRLLTAKFSYYFAKSQSTEVVPKRQKKFMGADPVITLKDSSDTDVNYFQEIFYNDSLYTMSMKYLDKAIRQDADRLDLRSLKATALVAYEKESPDMALAYLEKIIDENVLVDGKWEYPGLEVTDTLFPDIIQEFCFTFFNIGSQGSYSAFYSLSEKMLDYYPDMTVFMDNVGSYYLVVEKDYKTALKYYNKVLKAVPDDYTAIKNSVIIARRQKNTKLEKKYLQMLAKYGPESERLTAEARLKVL